MTNKLHTSNSPYLLQHAGNPVHWQIWNEETLEKAKALNKPILISVGYAACHWCHVMEKECFEDPEVARVMNENFINIKVDREERPDIDQVYMSALQIMTNSGGWPMNIVALPDGRPFWGATYLKKEQWVSVLKQLGELYQNEPAKIEDYASRLTEGIGVMNSLKPPVDKNLPDKEALHIAIQHWKQYMDQEYGGRKGAPKFMMPVNLNFMLAYTHLSEDEFTESHLKTTLKKIAYGGVYDHLGGGFARYSTDNRWHIPHFEMMLYDNAQLLSVYAMAYKKYKDPEYLGAIEGIHSFIRRELTGPKGEFYSSLDADSLNEKGIQEEGAFYTWTEKELEELLGKDLEIFRTVFNINAKGYWENGRYVLFRSSDFDSLAALKGMDSTEFGRLIKSMTGKLLAARSKRPHPGLDDKCLTSWNAMTITGLVNAFLATGENKYLETALDNITFLEQHMFSDDNSLLHSYRKGKTAISGFLEDYCFLIEACILLYQAGCGENYLMRARDLCNYTLDNFFVEKHKMFGFTSKNDPGLINTPVEKSDNVIPASNSVMAHNLYTLGTIFGNMAYLNLSEAMLVRMKDDMRSYGYSHANWLHLALKFTYPAFEIAITGDNAVHHTLEIQKNYLPNVVVAHAEAPSNIPLLKGRFQNGKELFYVCRDQQCDLPVSDLMSCLKQVTNSSK